MSKMACAKCGQAPKFKCERCLEPYCSSECQVGDWQDHKGRCYKFPNLIPMHIFKPSTMGQALPDEASSKRMHVVASPILNDSASSYKQKSQNPNENSEISQCAGGAKPKRILEDRDFALLPKTNTQPLSTNKPDDSNLITSVPSVPEKALMWREAFSPPTGFFDAIVQFIEERQNNKRFIWITEVKNDSALQKLMSEINRSVNTSLPYSPELIMPGALVAAPLNKILYRAEVLCTSPESQRADIRLIDYGNEMRVAYNHVFAPIPIMVNLNAFAIRVCISNDCGPLELESILTIRVVGEKPSEGYYTTECKTKTIPIKLDVESLIREQSLSVVKFFVCGQSALLRLNTGKELDMDPVLNSPHTLEYEFDEVPMEGTFVAARTTDGWKRACLLGCFEKEHLYLVYTIDDGFIGIAPQIKRIPDLFLNHPMKVFAVSTNSSEYMLSESMLTTTKKLSLKLLPSSSATVGKDPESHLPCALYDESRKIIDTLIASVFTGRLEELNLKLWHDQISEGSNVFVSHVLTYKEIFIASNHTKEYQKIIVSEGTKCTAFESNDNICEGDMVIVLVKPAVYYRAEVLLCESKSYKVRNVDNGSEQTVDHKYLRKPTQMLRSLPVRCSLVKLMYLESVPTPIANNKALAALETCMKNHTEFCVTFANGTNQTADLLFQTKERQSLCKKLLPMVFEPCDEHVETVPAKIQNVVNKALPLPKQNNLPLTPPNTPVTTHVPASIHSNDTIKHRLYTLDDLEIIPIACGENCSLYVLDATTLLNTDGPYITAADYNNKQFLAKMEKYLLSVGTYCNGPTSPKGGYAPKKMEICLSVFADDGEWYRALCIDHHPNENFVVMFLDYGNVAKVNKKDIMPITAELLFPSNANMVYIEDITNKEQALKFAKATQANPIISAKVIRLPESDAYMAKVHRIEQLSA